ncbi:DUF4178 domain-containing protein [Desulfothermus okinawensis JCM 13304]
MGIFDFLKSLKKNKEQDVELVGFNLEDLNVGSVIELDGESWEVKSKGYYDYGDEKEWDYKIQSSTREGFLNKDEEGIYLFVRDDLTKLSINLFNFLKTHDDLPSEVMFNGKPYNLTYSGAAYYCVGDSRTPVVIWDFEDSEGNILEILQWSDDDFELFLGRKIQEWEIEDVFSKK